MAAELGQRRRLAPAGQAQVFDGAGIVELDAEILEAAGGWGGVEGAGFATAVGASSELGRLAFQTLMQRLAPEGALGRVFVRYEVLFQLAWVAGAMIPALTPINFRQGALILAALYLVAIVGYLTPDFLARRRG